MRELGESLCPGGWKNEGKNLKQGNRRLFKLVGVTGAAGSGKDSVAQGLVKVGFVQYALAWPIKHALNAIFGWEMAQWDDRAWKEAEIEELGFSPRRAAQTLGTEWGRGMKEDLWLSLADFRLKGYDHAIAQALALQAANPGTEAVLPKGMVVSDIRFENEAQWVRNSGGQIWHIVRPGVEAVAAHSSEAGVKRESQDIVLYNSGSLEGLQRAAQINVGEEQSQ